METGTQHTSTTLPPSTDNQDESKLDDWYEVPPPSPSSNSPICIDMDIDDEWQSIDLPTTTDSTHSSHPNKTFNAISTKPLGSAHCLFNQVPPMCVMELNNPFTHYGEIVPIKLAYEHWPHTVKTKYKTLFKGQLSLSAEALCGLYPLLTNMPETINTHHDAVQILAQIASPHDKIFDSIRQKLSSDKTHKTLLAIVSACLRLHLNKEDPLVALHTKGSELVNAFYPGIKPLSFFETNSDVQQLRLENPLPRQQPRGIFKF